MKTLFETYSDKAIFLMVYIREAHPARADQTAENADWKAIDGVVFHQPEKYKQRLKLVEAACTFWELNFPALVDVIEPSIGNLYNASPNRLYIIDTEGRIAYRGSKGPRGVNAHEGELELRKLLGITEGKPVTRPRSTGPSGRGRLRRGGKKQDG